MVVSKVASISKKREDNEGLLSSVYGIRSLCKPKENKKKVTKDSIAFCCSKSGMDERDINQCTHTVV
jgi:hypothetical protein